MTTRNGSARRSYGAGSLYSRSDSAGRESWYGRWRAGGRQHKRCLGLVRQDGATQIGLTRTQAEKALRAAMGEAPTKAARTAGERMTLDAAGQQYRTHLERIGRKRTTVAAVESALRVQLVPFFAGKSLDKITHDDVADLIATLEGKGLAAKSIRNYVGILSALFNFARHRSRRWVTENPCGDVELPGVPESDEIRFLDEAEWEAVLRHVQPGLYERIDRGFYLTAIMAGLRHGELLALRWRDVDWTAGKIRVRQNWVLGQLDTPKSKRGSRAVPLADRLGGELERLHEASGRPGDDALVFADPVTGRPLDKACNLRRYRRALKSAGLDLTHNLHGLRHTFGTRCASAGVPMRSLQEWMGHADIATTERYAAYAPSQHEADMMRRVWAPLDHGHVRGHNLSESHST